MKPELHLSASAAAEVLVRAGRPRARVRSAKVKRRNDVYRLRVADGEATYYLKAHTKDWYQADPFNLARRCVIHEAAAWECLRRRGLAVPSVIAVETGSDNPLGWPYILTARLAGDRLTKLLGRASRRDFQRMLQRAGEYLRSAHDIEFVYPGYLMDPEGPPEPSDSSELFHAIHTAAQAKAWAMKIAAFHEPELSPEVLRYLDALYDVIDHLVAHEYQPPRFLFGDFHAGHLFVHESSGRWRVAGVLDMEVASGGAPLHDVIMFSIEMIARFDASTRWWEPFFSGYGTTPPLERIRLGLLTTGRANFAAHGAQRWPATIDQTYRAAIRARDWFELFSINRP